MVAKFNWNYVVATLLRYFNIYNALTQLTVSRSLKMSSI